MTVDFFVCLLTAMNLENLGQVVNQGTNVMCSRWWHGGSEAELCALSTRSRSLGCAMAYAP